MDVDTLEVVKEGRRVECARKGGSCVAVNYKWNADSSVLRFSDEACSTGLKAESIVLFVDDKGVATITWSNPLEILKTEVENIEILPFEQVQGLIKQAIFIGLSWWERDTKNVGGMFHATRIALSSVS